MAPLTMHLSVGANLAWEWPEPFIGSGYRSVEVMVQLGALSVCALARRIGPEGFVHQAAASGYPWSGVTQGDQPRLRRG